MPIRRAHASTTGIYRDKAARAETRIATAITAAHSKENGRREGRTLSECDRRGRVVKITVF